MIFWAQNHLQNQVFGAFKGFLGLLGAFEGFLGLLRAFWGFFGAFLGLFGAFWGFLGLFCGFLGYFGGFCKSFEVGNLGASAALNPNRVQVRVGMQEGGEKRALQQICCKNAALQGQL